MFVAEQMLAQASAETGLSDFGDEAFREGLQRLVDASNRGAKRGAKLNAIGEMAFAAEMHRLLVNRLRFADDLKRHPEILDEALDDPIIILGLPRTGTTKLQRLIAADPQIQSLKAWQMLNPALIPGAPTGDADPRIEIGRQTIGMIAQASPGLMQSHPLDADLPEEDIFLQMFNFVCQATYMSQPAHEYATWVDGQSMRGTYRYTKQLLQYLQWQDGGRHSRRWVLKTPLHLGNLDLLHELFPRAHYVCTHRELREVLPSFCRLMEMFWRMKTDDVDLHHIGRYVIDFWSGQMQRHLEQRDQLGDRLSILDVGFEEVRDDAFGVIRRIYQHADQPFTPQCEQAMHEWEQRDPHGRYGGYQCTLEQYGLDANEVDVAFAEYRHRLLIDTPPR